MICDTRWRTGQGRRRVIVPITLPNSSSQGYAVLQLVGFSESAFLPSATANSDDSFAVTCTPAIGSANIVWSVPIESSSPSPREAPESSNIGVEINDRDKDKRPAAGSPLPMRTPAPQLLLLQKKGCGSEPATSQAELDRAGAVPTTFVQADTNSFKEVVQKLTGASDDSQEKLPITMPARYAARSPALGEPAAPGRQEGALAKQNPAAPQAQSHHGCAAANKPGIEVGPRKSPFKLHLHERRQNMRKLQISLGLNSLRHNNPVNGLSPRAAEVLSPSMLDLPALVLSPVTPLGSDPFDCPSNSTSCNDSSMSQEEKAIAEKGFYLHPSPLHTPRDSEPELLPLFPLHSPRESSS